MTSSGLYLRALSRLIRERNMHTRSSELTGTTVWNPSQVWMGDAHAQAPMRGRISQSHCRNLSQGVWMWREGTEILLSSLGSITHLPLSVFKPCGMISLPRPPLKTCRNGVWMKTPERNLGLQRPIGWLEFQYCEEIGMLQDQKASCLILGVLLALSHRCQN